MSDEKRYVIAEVGSINVWAHPDGQHAVALCGWVMVDATSWLEFHGLPPERPDDPEDLGHPNFVQPDSATLRVGPYPDGSGGYSLDELRAIKAHEES